MTWWSFGESGFGITRSGIDEHSAGKAPAEVDPEAGEVLVSNAGWLAASACILAQRTVRG
jgi:hypothetical protein